MTRWVYRIQLEQFEGPLDLLLQLILQEELDVTKVSLAKVTDDYLNYIKGRKLDPLELSDFLVVASRLIYIKSKALLPYLILEEEEDPSLLNQLKIYREYYEAARVLQKIILKRKFSYVRERLPAQDLGFQPPKSLTAAKLAAVFALIIGALRPLLELPKEVIRKIISIQEKISELRKIISEQAALGFREFLRASKTRMEAVISFLALLELIKQKIVEVEQTGLFGEIEVKKI